MDPVAQQWNLHTYNLVSFATSTTKVTQGWYANSGGTYARMIYESNDAAAVRYWLEGMKVSPKYVYVGQSYDRSGPFIGSLDFAYAGRRVYGKFVGTDIFHTKITGHERVTVRSGTYDAIKGTVSFNITGTVTVKDAGEIYTGNVTISQTQTFWAVPGIGMVKDQSSTYTRMSSAQTGKQIVRISQLSELAAVPAS